MASDYPNGIFISFTYNEIQLLAMQNIEIVYVIIQCTLLCTVLNVFGPTSSTSRLSTILEKTSTGGYNATQKATYWEKRTALEDTMLHRKLHNERNEQHYNLGVNSGSCFSEKEEN